MQIPHPLPKLLPPHTDIEKTGGAGRGHPPISSTDEHSRTLVPATKKNKKRWPKAARKVRPELRLRSAAFL